MTNTPPLNDPNLNGSLGLTEDISEHFEHVERLQRLQRLTNSQSAASLSAPLQSEFQMKNDGGSSAALCGAPAILFLLSFKMKQKYQKKKKKKKKKEK